MTCVAIIRGPDGGIACGKPAQYVVEFGDGTKADMCTSCAASMRHMAAIEYKTVIRVTKPESV